jgi:hypothetical protein
VTIEQDQGLMDKFERFTVTGITTPLPGPDPNPEGLLAASFLRAADLDGDGRKEIVVTQTLGNSLDFYVKDGGVAVFKRTSNDLSTWTQSIIRADFAFANDVLLRDVDGDGYTDIMVFDNFLGGAYTNYPSGIYLLRNLGGDVTAPDNWEKITIHAKDPDAALPDRYERAKRRGSYHQAYFVDLDGDGLEDFVTTHISMEIWQARPESIAPLDPISNPCGDPCYEQQYMWIEWFKAETDLGTYPTGFSGPYDIGDGAGFLFGMADVDDDGLLDVLAPQFFIHNPGQLVVKGFPEGSDPYGDSFVWFKNPGEDILAADPDYAWERYTINNWYTSPTALGQGFMAFPADITNDGINELIFTTHNHQEAYNVPSRIWPSGVYYLPIPDNPYEAANWEPVAIDTGLAYWIDRPGGPLGQGSPGHAAVGDVTGNGLADLVVAGDGRGALYYYEAVEAGEGCSLKFKRAALYDDPACMGAEIKLYDIDGDGNLEIVATVFDTSQAKDSSSGSVFIWKLIKDPVLVELAEFKAMGLFNKVLLKWTTAAEIENAGFNILRADSEGGPYVQINAALIPAKGDPMRGHTYRYLDKDAELGKTYYYKLEDVDLNGTRTLHGPVSASTGFGLFNIR